LQNKVFAATYRMALPQEALIAAEMDRTRRMLEVRRAAWGEEPSAPP
jgi:hypothetical protein